MGPKDIIALLLLILLRGSVQLILLLSLPYYPPFSFIALRGVAASLILGFITLVKYKTSVTFKRDFKALTKKFILLELMMGTLNVFVPFVIFTYTVDSIGEDIGALFMATTSFFVFAFTPIFGDSVKEPFTKSKFGGVLLGVAGVGLVSAAGFLFGKDKATKSPYPYLICLGGVMSQACAVTLWKRFSKIILKSDPKEILGVRELVGVWGQNVVTATLGIIGAFAWDWTYPPPHLAVHFMWIKNIGDWQSIFVLVWMSFVGAVIVSLCIFYLIGSIGASLTSAATCGYPIVALVEGIVFLKLWSKLELGGILMQVAGTLLVIIGLLVSLTLSRKTAAPPAQVLDSQIFYRDPPTDDDDSKADISKRDSNVYSPIGVDLTEIEGSSRVYM